MGVISTTMKLGFRSGMAELTSTKSKRDGLITARAIYCLSKTPPIHVSSLVLFECNLNQKNWPLLSERYLEGIIRDGENSYDFRWSTRDLDCGRLHGRRNDRFSQGRTHLSFTEWIPS